MRPPLSVEADLGKEEGNDTLSSKCESWEIAAINPQTIIATIVVVSGGGNVAVTPRPPVRLLTHVQRAKAERCQKRPAAVAALRAQ